MYILKSAYFPTMYFWMKYEQAKMLIKGGPLGCFVIMLWGDTELTTVKVII